MHRVICKSKIHGAVVTAANLRYEGSIAIDGELLRAADILPMERVQIVNLNNGSRVETYCMEGKSGEICLNGPAARWGQIGDRIHIVSYSIMSDEEAKSYRIKKIFVDEKNQIKK